MFYDSLMIVQTIVTVHRVYRPNHNWRAQGPRPNIVRSNRGSQKLEDWPLSSLPGFGFRSFGNPHFLKSPSRMANSNSWWLKHLKHHSFEMEFSVIFAKKTQKSWKHRHLWRPSPVTSTSWEEAKMPGLVSLNILLTLSRNKWNWVDLRGFTWIYVDFIAKKNKKHEWVDTKKWERMAVQWENRLPQPMLVVPSSF